MPACLVEDTRRAIQDSLRHESLQAVREAFGRSGLGVADCLDDVWSLAQAADVPAIFTGIVQKVLGDRATPDGKIALARWLLIQASVVALEKLGGLAVDDSVKSLFCTEFRFFADPEIRWIKDFQPDHNASLRSMCRVALLKRFPAGQSQWELSGFPRSWLGKVPRRSLPSLLSFLTTKLRGFSPLFELHTSSRTIVLLEKEANQSYYRLAKTLAMQPSIKGIMMASWFHSPETFRVSRHLAWLNEVFAKNNAFLTTLGPAGPNSGFLAGSVVRRKLYEKGEFKPTIGLVLWARNDAIAWAAAHPEFDEASLFSARADRLSGQPR
jgi:hypothetical protein